MVSLCAVRIIDYDLRKSLGYIYHEGADHLIVEGGVGLWGLGAGAGILSKIKKIVSADSREKILCSRL